MCVCECVSVCVPELSLLVLYFLARLFLPTCIVVLLIIYFVSRNGAKKVKC